MYMYRLMMMMIIIIMIIIIIIKKQQHLIDPIILQTYTQHSH